MRQREQGETDISSILLGVAAELQSFDYDETFTGAFEACPASTMLSPPLLYKDSCLTRRREGKMGPLSERQEWIGEAGMADS